MFVIVNKGLSNSGVFLFFNFWSEIFDIYYKISPLVRQHFAVINHEMRRLRLLMLQLMLNTVILKS